MAEINSNQHYLIKSVHSNKCLEVVKGEIANGSNIHQWEENNTIAQQFIIEEVGNSTYKIVNLHSGKALDIAEWQQENGGNLQQWDFHGGNNQLFRLVPVSSELQPPTPDNNDIKPLFSSATGSGCIT
ncbi:RICIN domain-containing protein [Endozoicomonas sp. SM1973]|uniref:RICIN domain-containing protein n=1 Tax=Spartinivicinus marinus TaxID=2994442 RepID=A0A853I948_9GAMM|nr:RICIN domain-containing protein [Spartinivicinus marinus]MCX4030103.1 RICIN domain-containing protein [Spartinivicinus marinus]NYZ69389.1 RICIN domain-containing protein [Spartinivicinus marinus]